MKKTLVLKWLGSIMDTQELPRLPVRFIDYIEPGLNKSTKVFEYGCGWSSFYFDKRVIYKGVEHDRRWYDFVMKHRKELKGKITLTQDKWEYIDAIGNDSYDIIIIDGIHRNECMMKALKHINKGGIIVLDDANRDEYDSSYLDSRYSHMTFGGLRYNSWNINSKGYFEGNITRLWFIDNV